MNHLATPGKLFFFDLLIAGYIATYRLASSSVNHLDKLIILKKQKYCQLKDFLSSMIGYLKMVRVITGAWESTERPRAHTGRGNRDRRGEILLYSSHNCIRLIEQCHEINFEKKWYFWTVWVKKMGLY